MYKESISNSFSNRLALHQVGKSIYSRILHYRYAHLKSQFDP